MRLLVLTDIHDEEHVLDAIDQIKYDVLFILGDISAHSQSFYQDALSKPHVFAIPGNNENQRLQQLLFSTDKSLHQKTREIHGIKLAGFGYSPPTPFNTPGEMEEEEIYQHLSTLELDNSTVLGTHAPPYGFFDEVGDRHVGCHALRKIIDEKSPGIVLSGHIHEHQGVQLYKNTLIVKIRAAYFGSGCIIEPEENLVNSRVEFIRL